MYDEYKKERMVALHAIKDEHRLDGEVPWTSTIGCRHDDGDTSHYERDKGAAHTQPCGCVETEKSKIIILGD